MALVARLLTSSRVVRGAMRPALAGSLGASNTIAYGDRRRSAKQTPATTTVRSLHRTAVAKEHVFDELQRDFVAPEEMYQALNSIGISFFTGVPDSLLKDFCAYVTAHTTPDKHVIAANEGTAVSIATGHYLATGKFPCVYLQNSGLGNCVNPLLSLVHQDVYSIPMLILIGWRGEPGKKDEPQHRVQGELTPSLLASLGLAFQVMPDYIEGVERTLQTAKQHMSVSNEPYVLLVKRQTFSKFEGEVDEFQSKYELSREQVLETLIPLFHEKDVIVGTTGMLSRELFEQRVRFGHSHEKDLLTVGSMGHAPAIGLGISLARPRRRVIVLDGDGAALMHMGNMGTIPACGHSNLKHVLINNQAHDSVGGQPTVASNDNFSFTKIAEGCGYHGVFRAETREEIATQFENMMNVSSGPAFLEIMARPNASRKDLGRPTRSPLENRNDFMSFLERI